MKSRKSTQSSLPFHVKILSSFLFLFSGIFFLYHPGRATSSQGQEIHRNKAIISSIALSITPFFPPIPTSTPTPTPQAANTPPANTFCLQVPIILYHHIEPYAQAQLAGHAQLTVDSTFFEQQMSYLQSSGYHTLTLDAVVQALLTHQQLPPKSIAVTIDDGYSDNYEYAFPILKKYGMIGNFVIPTGLMENPGYMTWSHVKELVNNGMGIYNHTWSHAALGGVGKDQMQYEISTAGQKIAEVTGKKSTILVYPYGSFSPLAIQVLKENGYIAGFSTIHGTWQCESNIMHLYRLHIGNAPLSFYGL